MTNAEADKAALDQLHEFMRLLGTSIQSWKHIEGALFEIYMVLVSDGPISIYNIASPNMPAIAAAYESVINFTTTISMIDAAAKVRLYHSTKLLERWTQLQEKTIGHSKIRNRLVHHGTQIKYLKNRRVKFVLVKHPDRESSPDNKPYSKRQIARFSDDFYTLSQQLAAFRGNVVQCLYGLSPSKSDAQSKNRNSTRRGPNAQSHAKP